ncbi:MAG: 16S rRNA (uracil(1498)-N(3))-methyltransferase [Cytophagaceae bacterium]|nr:16S rRNA (uracil(1498)-N(3))-methyltransferase [Cytophagaceae bacterium]
MPVFFQPDIADQPFLSEEESRHAVKVLRMNAGETLQIADGRGGWYEAEIRRADARRCEVSILRKTIPAPRPFYIHLAIAPTKNMDRVEWMLEKCVEIGLDEISFIESRYSERRALKLERLRSVAISALKQAQQAWLPRLNDLGRLTDFLKKFPVPNPDSQLFIGHLEEGERKLLQREAKPGQKYVVLIGPEGDFSTEEIQWANATGFQSISLGSSRLRTETAGLVAVHILNLINQ